MAKPRPEPFTDPDQPILFDALPPPPPRWNDAHALAGARALVDELTSAKTHPWSPRQLWVQRRRFDAFAKMLTPVEAAALSARFEAELERLGEPVDDFWAEP